MKITIKIDVPADDPKAEVARILHKLGDCIENDHIYLFCGRDDTIRDPSGVPCGTMTVR